MQIHELTAKTSLDSTDVIALDTGSVTNKITAANLATSLKSIGSLVTGVKGNAESSYRTGNVNLTPANVGALSLGGGTMNGPIGVNTGDDYSTAPSSTDTNTVITANDTNSEPRNGLYAVRYTDGRYATLLSARDGQGTAEQFGPCLDMSGNPSYVVTSPAALRSAIGATSLSDVVAASGSYSFGSVAAGATSNYAVTESIGTSNYIVTTECNTGSCTIYVTGRSSTGFTLNVRNVTSAASTPTVRWAVIKLP